jgi:hypothetical protein
MAAREGAAFLKASEIFNETVTRSKKFESFAGAHDTAPTCFAMRFQNTRFPSATIPRSIAEHTINKEQGPSPCSFPLGRKTAATNLSLPLLRVSGIVKQHRQLDASMAELWKPGRCGISGIQVRGRVVRRKQNQGVEERLQR